MIQIVINVSDDLNQMSWAGMPNNKVVALGILEAVKDMILRPAAAAPQVLHVPAGVLPALEAAAKNLPANG